MGAAEIGLAIGTAFGVLFTTATSFKSWRDANAAKNNTSSVANGFVAKTEQSFDEIKKMIADARKERREDINDLRNRMDASERRDDQRFNRLERRIDSIDRRIGEEQ